MPVISDDFLNFICRNLRRLDRMFSSPFQLYYGPGIRRTLRGIRSDFVGQGLDMTELFAVKALPRKAIVEIIVSEGGGSDCSSYDEITLVREAKTPPGRIMLTSNNTPQSLYRYAMAEGGSWLNLDDKSYVAKVPDPFPKTISFRLNPGKILLPGEKTDELEFSSEGAKFGVPPDEIMDAYDMAIQRGAESIGIHLMVLSNNRDYRKAAAVIDLECEVLGDAVQKFGVNGAYVNIGGGIGIQYRPEDPQFDMPALARECRLIMEKFKARHGYIPKLFMESGRFVTGPHGVLVNRIVNVFSKFGHKFLGVQIGMQGIPRVALYKTAYHHPIILNPDGSLKDGPLEKVSIVGAVCEDTERLATDVLLPAAKEGDFVISCCSGAHCAEQAPPYNWQRHPQELLVENDHTVRRICSAQTYEGLMARQRGLESSDHILNLD